MGRGIDSAHKQEQLVSYLVELTLADVKFLRYPPSHQAAAALFLVAERPRPPQVVLLLRRPRLEQMTFE